MTHKARVAAVQAQPVWMDLDGTVDKTVELITEAAGRGAQLVAFPEVWVPGYPMFLLSPRRPGPQFVTRYRQNSMAADSPQMNRIREAARDNEIIVVVGYSERYGSSLYMAQTIIGVDGAVLHHRRKLKPTGNERTLFGESDGSGIKVVDTPIGRLGALNCGEHLQPLTKFAMYAQHEQIHVASWPCLATGIELAAPAMSPETLSAVCKVYANEGAVFTIMTSQVVRQEDARIFEELYPEGFPQGMGGGGYARVYAPNSTLVSTPLDPFEEGLAIADIDLADIEPAKNVLDPAGHYARPDVFQVTFDNRERVHFSAVGGPEPVVFRDLAAEDVEDDPVPA